MSGDPEPRGRRLRFVLAVDALRDGPWGAPEAAHGRVMVWAPWSGGDPPFGWGDRIEAAGRLFLPSPAAVPGAFDRRAYLAVRAVHAGLHADVGGVRFVRAASVWFPGRWAGAIRRRVMKTFQERLSSRGAALLAGVVLGRKPQDFPDMDRDFRESGTYHLLVASGSNVAAVMALAFLAARWGLWLKGGAAWIAAAAAAFLYAAVAGGDPPVVRAAVMAAALVAGGLMDRWDRLEHAIFLSAGVLLLHRPESLFDPGFQMSYAATLGAAVGVPVLDGALSRRLPAVWPAWTRRCLRWTAGLFFVSLAAQVALTPLLLYYFHRWPWVGLGVNMAAVAWTGVCLPLGLILAFLDGLWPQSALTSLSAWAADKAAALLAFMARSGARIRGGEILCPLNAPQAAGMGILLVGAAWALLARRKGSRPGVIAGLSTGALGVALLGFAGPQRPPQGTLSAAWVPGRARAAAVLFLPDGGAAVVDPGTPEDVAYGLVPFLRSRGVDRLERVFLLRRPSMDALDVLSGEFPIKSLCASSAAAAGPWAARARVPLLAADQDMAWSEGGLHWRLWPVPKQDASALAAVFDGRVLLFAPDIAPRAWPALSARLPAKTALLSWSGRSAPPLAARWTVVAAARPRRAVRAHSWAGIPRYVADEGALEWTAFPDGSRLNPIGPGRELSLPPPRS